MNRLREHQTAIHLMMVFEQNNGIGLHGTTINRSLIAKGYIHTGKALMDNLKWLISKGKIAKAMRGVYGIPTVRADGTKYLIVEDTKETIEVEISGS